MNTSLNFTTAVLAGWTFYFVFAADASAFVLRNTEVTGILQLDQQYSDNMFYSRLDPLEDYLTTLASRLLVENKNERLNCRLEGGVKQLVYARHSELNDTDYDFGGKATYQFSEVSQFDFSSSFQKDSRIDQDLDSTGLLLGTSAREKYISSFGFGHFYDEKTQLQASYSFSGENYSDLNTDYTYHQASLSLNRKLDSFFPKTVGMVAVLAGYYDYESSAVQQVVAQVGLEKRITETLSVKGEAGPRLTRTEYSLQSVPILNSWGLSGDLSFTYTGEKEWAESSVRQELSPSSGRQGPMQQTTVSASYMRQFTKDFSWRLAGRYTHNRSNESLNSSQNINEHSYRLIPSLGYAVSDNLRVDFSYDYLFVNDDKDVGTLKRSMLLLRLVGDVDMAKWVWP